MKWLFLIYDNEQKNISMSQENMGKKLEEWFKYTDELRESEILLDGSALQPTMTATTVRVGNAAPLATDGHFAETKDQLGGFYMVDALNLDDAIAWAGKMPHIADGGSVEIRPNMEFDH